MIEIKQINIAKTNHVEIIKLKKFISTHAGLKNYRYKLAAEHGVKVGCITLTFGFLTRRRVY